MRCYLLHGDRVTVLPAHPASIPDHAVLVESASDLDQRRFPTARLILLWNALPGAEPVRRFKDRSAAIKRFWSALEALPISTSRSDSKQARLLALLRRPDGASMDDLMAATGWQSHSVRGVLSGVLRKKLGLDVSSSRVGAVRVYRIAA